MKIPELFNKYYQVIEVVVSEKFINYKLAIFVYRNSNIKLLKKGSFNNFDELEKNLKVDSPVLLFFSGQLIINRVIDGQFLLDEINKNIYISFLKQNQKLFFSMIRKQYVDEIIDMFENKNFSVLSVHIGVFSFVSLIEVIETKKINTPYGTFIFDNNQLIDYNNKLSNQDKLIQLGDEFIEYNYILHYSVLLQYIYPNDDYYSTDLDFRINKEEWNYKILFNKISRFFFISLFVFLLINYMLHNYLSDNNIKLLQQTKIIRQYEDKIKSLESDIKNKEEILSKSILFVDKYLSFYINKITMDLPSTINFDRMLINPIIKDNFVEDKKIKFNNKTIIIYGNTTAVRDFRDWIKELNKIDWINNITISKYSGVNNSFILTIKIQ